MKAICALGLFVLASLAVTPATAEQDKIKRQPHPDAQRIGQLLGPRKPLPSGLKGAFGMLGDGPTFKSSLERVEPPTLLALWHDMQVSELTAQRGDELLLRTAEERAKYYAPHFASSLPSYVSRPLKNCAASHPEALLGSAGKRATVGVRFRQSRVVDLRVTGDLQVPLRDCIQEEVTSALQRWHLPILVSDEGHYAGEFTVPLAVTTKVFELAPSQVRYALPGSHNAERRARFQQAVYADRALVARCLRSPEDAVALTLTARMLIHDTGRARQIRIEGTPRSAHSCVESALEGISFARNGGFHMTMNFVLRAHSTPEPSSSTFGESMPSIGAFSGQAGFGRGRGKVGGGGALGTAGHGKIEGAGRASTPTK